MDRFYHGVETLLLASGFALGVFALTLASPTAPMAGQISVSLPMLAVTADR